MIIREHTANDSDALIDLMQIADCRTLKWAAQRVSSYLNKNGRKTIFVAEEDSTLTGYVGIKEFEENSETRKILGKSIDDFACITWIAVHPQYRRRGIATALLQNCEPWTQDKVKLGIWLDCRENILPLYESANIGYRVMGHYNHKGSNRFVLLKEI
jgi:ribosomal protein S18 acetylase RimI-like enzyme